MDEREQYWARGREREDEYQLLERREKAARLALDFASMSANGARSIEELVRHADVVDEFLRTESYDE